MKILFMTLGIIGILASLQIVQATQLGLYRTPLPGLLVGRDYQYCMHQEGDFRNSRQEARYFCRCVTKRIQAQFYLEEYIVALARQRLSQWNGENWKPSAADQTRKREIYEYCEVDLSYEYQEPEEDQQD